MQAVAEMKHIHNKMSVEVVERRRTTNQDLNECFNAMEDRLQQEGIGASGSCQSNINTAEGDRNAGVGAPENLGVAETSA